MNNNKKKILIAIGIIVAILSIVGVSYALWTYSAVQTKKNLVQLDCFNVQFNETIGSNIQLTNTFPLTDSEGKALDPYQFSISNECASYASYQVRIEVKKESKLDDKYLKVMLNQNTPQILTNDNYENSDILLGENTNKAYVIETGYLNSNETKNFDLRLWLDESVTTSTLNEDGTNVQNSKWSGIITISSSYAEEMKAVLAGKEIPVVEEGNGLYAVTHTDATSMEEGWQQTEYRYAGVNYDEENNPTDYVHNYVNFNGETWRIIGLVNVKTESGEIEQRLKIIKNSELPQTLKWNEINVNDWTQATLMTYLNSGEYYTTELKNQAKEMIDDKIIWNIAPGNAEEKTPENYGNERGTEVYDDTRSTEWKKDNTVAGTTYHSIGLMYPSDYGYAVGEESRNCIENKPFYDLNLNDYSKCKENNWLFLGPREWLLTSDSSNIYTVFNVQPIGRLGADLPSNTYSVRPVVYLKSDVKIVDGTGAYNDAYQLEAPVTPPTLIATIQALPIQKDDSGASGIYEVKHDEANITWDGTEAQKENLLKTEYRYAGPNYQDKNSDYVHNYVNIEGQVWRIIGLVNTPEGQRIKLVKDESIGEYSWDSSSSGINSGAGVNEWNESDLMKLLNEGFGENKLENYNGKIQDTYVNNSLYWRGEKGQCYTNYSNTATDCGFTDNKIPDSLKNMIEEITWNTGSNGEASDIKVNEFYNLERSGNTGKICDDNIGSECNDKVARTTNWKGKIGLIYPSDYGYATSGGTGTTRTSCFGRTLNSWDNYNECKNNDWLLFDSWYWTVSPRAFSDRSGNVFTIGSAGYVSDYGASNAGGVRPSVYLKPDVLVSSGNGTKETPFQLGLLTDSFE